MKKALILILVILMAICLVACGEPEDNGTSSSSSSSSSDNHEHQFNIGDVVDPTCEEDGYTMYECYCGETYSEPIEALGHTYTTEIVKQPTCDEPGEMINTCYCGYGFYEYIDPVDHNWSMWLTVTDATYNTAGVEEHFCYDCDFRETRETPTNTLEQELERYATLATMLPYFESVGELGNPSNIADTFHWVRINAGYISSDYDEETYMVTLVYSLDAFDRVMQSHFGITVDFEAYAANNESMTIDKSTNRLTWVTGGMGGWAQTGFESVNQIDDTQYAITYYIDEDGVTVGYGTLNVRFTGEGLVIESNVG